MRELLDLALQVHGGLERWRDEGHMLVYGSLTGEPIQVGANPRFILAGHRILEVFWVSYWFPGWMRPHAVSWSRTSCRTARNVSPRVALR